ncbi:GNAT family N-acetyltransferase [Myroides sp. LJL116]
METISLQPALSNEQVTLIPLSIQDLMGLYEVAKDPKIWEQHPNKDRWEYSNFIVFFENALLSKGAFKIVDNATQQIIGSTRFYNYDLIENSIMIGFTFFSREYWGKGYNALVKQLMLDYIFTIVDKVIFHIGANNIRSQMAIEKIGAKKVAQELVDYPNEEPRLNCIYQITKEDWQKTGLSKQ